MRCDIDKENGSAKLVVSDGQDFFVGEDSNILGRLSVLAQEPTWGVLNKLLISQNLSFYREKKVLSWKTKQNNLVVKLAEYELKKSSELNFITWCSEISSILEQQQVC